MVVKNRRNISAAEFPLRTKGSQPHTGLLSPDHHCWKEEFSQHPDVKTSEDSIQVRRRPAVNSGILLKDPCLAFLADRLTHPELQHWSSSSKINRDIQKKKQIVLLKGKDWRDSSGQNRNVGGSHCSFTESSSHTASTSR